MALIFDTIETNNNNNETDNTIYQIYKQVKGATNSGCNDVLIFKNTVKLAKYNLIYFGGDVQDYPEDMLKSSTGKKYSKWNLIDTGKLLLKKFAKSYDHVANIILIRADHFHLKTFANYSNFLFSNDFGAPINPKEKRKLSLNSTDEEIQEDEEPPNDILNQAKCWQHLKYLFENSLNLFNREHTSLAIDSNLPIILCGFSKGCIVLNQLCTELVIKDLGFDEFRNKITHLIYLDGGHCGTSNAWITQENVINLIKCLNWTCYVYITPYNMAARTFKLWAIKEHEIFIELLNKNKVKLVNKCYFADENTDDFDLNKHFEILSEFEIFN